VVVRHSRSIYRIWIDCSAHLNISIIVFSERIVGRTARLITCWSSDIVMISIKWLTYYSRRYLSLLDNRSRQIRQFTPCTIFDLYQWIPWVLYEALFWYFSFIPLFNKTNNLYREIYMRYSLYMEFNSVMNRFFLNRFRNNDEISSSSRSQTSFRLPIDSQLIIVQNWQQKLGLENNSCSWLSRILLRRVRHNWLCNTLIILNTSYNMIHKESRFFITIERKSCYFSAI